MKLLNRPGSIREILVKVFKLLIMSGKLYFAVDEQRFCFKVSINTLFGSLKCFISKES